MNNSRNAHRTTVARTPLTPEERRALLGRTQIRTPEDRAIWQRTFLAERERGSSADVASHRAWCAVRAAQEGRRQISLPLPSGRVSARVLCEPVRDDEREPEVATVSPAQLSLPGVA